MTRLRRTIKRLISDVIERHSSAALFRLGATLTRSNPGAQSFLLREMLAHWKPEWRRHAIFETFESRLHSRNVITALAATKRSRNTALYTSLDQLTSRPSACVDYTRAFVEQRFVDAYDSWLTIPEVPHALESLAIPELDSLSHTMAVVLPGSTDCAYGSDIDSHDIVARTGILGPTPDETVLIGSRFDVSFLNSPRFHAMVQSPEPMDTSARRFVVDPMLRNLALPAWLSTPIDFDLTKFFPPTSPFSYAPLRIVPYCHQRGILPKLFFGDFYLGDVAYQASHYDPKIRLNISTKHTRSYLLH
ncbi:MAG: hypothetical protein ACKOI2_08870, partial [Actinomycetota bacterium]